MRNVAALTALLLAFVVAGCSFGPGADVAGKKWIALIEKHHKALEDGEFDIKAFKEEARPIAEELRAKKDKKTNKVVLTEATLADFQRVSEAFGKLLKETGTPEQEAAYNEMIEIWTSDAPPADNGS